MSKKKTATTKTVTTSKPKYYVVLDYDQDIMFQGELDEVKESIKDYTDDMDDKEAQEFISDLTIHELSAGKKLNYTPAIIEIK